MKALRLLQALLVLLGTTFSARAQVVTAQPTFFRDTDAVTLIYDASQGNGALAGFAGPVYIWTGVVTNLSATNTQWRYTKSSTFGQGDPAALMTSLGNNRWSITLTPSVRGFYNVPAAEQILRLGMIFKNADGSIVGRSATGGDIFVDVFQGGYAARITGAGGASSGQFVTAGTTLNITGEASEASQLTLRLNGTQVAQQANASSITTGVTFNQPGRNVLRLSGQSATAQTATDSLVFFVRPAVVTAALPVGSKDGITYLSPTSVRLKLTAPGKQFVYVLGEFNNWQADAGYFMNRTADGNDWWVDVTGLVPGREYSYQYLVDGQLRVADPYCEKILDPNNDRFIPAVTYPSLKAYPTGLTTGIVSVLQTNQAPYQWTTTGYVRPKKTDLVVYELHLRDFIQRHDYETLRDTLTYLQRLGINAIELMPVNEFEGNDSWGYNPSFYFAPDKYYGTKDALKRLIDECHRRGMAVLLDVVLNHSFGQSPMVQMYFDGSRPTANSPWFNRDATHPFNVGYDFNHESAFTKYFSKRVMEFWLQEYRVDGYRFDLSKGFTQRNNPNDVGAWGAYDQSRINIWLDYQNTIRAVDPGAFIILEHFADNSEETVLANAGLMLWGNMNGAFAQAAQARNGGSNLNGLSYRSRGWQQPNLVGFAESHDEERIMVSTQANGLANAATGYDTKKLHTALQRVALNNVFLLGVPGPKMLWQFGELGYDVSINFNGRIGAKPIRWNYLDSTQRRALYNVNAAMAALKKSEPAFEATSWNQQLTSAMKGIQLSNGAGSDVVILGNFSLNDNLIDPFFPRTGKWYNYLRGDSLTVTNTSDPIALAAGEYAVYTSRRVQNPVVATTRAGRAVAAFGLTVAPNPASSRAVVRFTLAVPAPVRVSVYNVIGRLMQTVTLPGRQPAGAVQVPLALSSLPAGVYLVRADAGNSSATTRLVVQP
ncbi:T9SS type A sorting domain-containing protein [Hymenobacter busanensis]|uniref:T9SS type A sorting domain-containing protein n=1 Tax=Hymenobacter busanensis TaxID=2607656 RepID=A0A7L4ZUJ5_9BACT|nr:alpha-amylase family glycosyl hydrolase [Hymenobacter busanensis]KAA9339378.1 T9SS type A sorting domain-containing protein [Hymenobacter busanensis]QHJ06861.1 T9SS type A sorting domain-containing protein [Hymenobacter busanensis]